MPYFYIDFYNLLTNDNTKVIDHPMH